jgi:hypothetical protein
MKHALAIAFGLLSSLGAVAGKVPEGFLLLHDKDYHPPENSRVLKTMRMKMSSENLVLTMGELVLKGALTSTTGEEVQGLQINPDQARYLLTKSTSQNSFVLGGKEQVEPEEKAPLLQVSVILERAKDRWSARLEKGEATKEQEEALGELEDEWNADFDSEMYGTKPRRIGEQGEVDANDIPGFRDAAEGVKGKVTLTLVGEKAVNGERFARLKGTIDAVMMVKAEADDDPDTKIGLKGKIKLLRSLKYFTDTEIEMKGQMSMTVEGPGSTGPMKMTGSGPFDFSGLRVLE